MATDAYFHPFCGNSAIPALTQNLRCHHGNLDQFCTIIPGTNFDVSVEIEGFCYGVNSGERYDVSASANTESLNISSAAKKKSLFRVGGRFMVPLVGNIDKFVDSSLYGPASHWEKPDAN